MLSDEQRFLLFDYCLGLTSEQDSERAAELIACDPDAAKIANRIKASLSPLDTLGPEICPEELVESTVRRLSDAVRSEDLQLHRLLEAEQRRGTGSNFGPWRNIGQLAAMAAVLLAAIAIWFAPLGFARQKYWQQSCQAQMARVFQGFRNYISDHDNKMPAVAAPQGSYWWKVGHQGTENQSNTRNLWLLVRGDYVKPDDFICPGTKQNRVLRRNVRADLAELTHYNDFPTRNYITYSFRIRCYKTTTPDEQARKVIMADSNPLFEKLPDDFAKSLRLQLSEKMMAINSMNHERQGQNILSCDGSIFFINQRQADNTGDDIYTLKEMKAGCEVSGCEQPSCESDAFLAP